MATDYSDVDVFVIVPEYTAIHTSKMPTVHFGDVRGRLSTELRASGAVGPRPAASFIRRSAEQPSRLGDQRSEKGTQPALELKP